LKEAASDGATYVDSMDASGAAGSATAPVGRAGWGNRVGRKRNGRARWFCEPRRSVWSGRCRGVWAGICR